MRTSENAVHPSALLKPEWTNILRRHSFEAEQAGKLMPEQLELIIEQQWFNLLAPARYGGLEKTLPEVVRMEEALSWADGSAGWVITLCTGAAWFGGFLDSNLAPAIFADRKVCFAGSGAATGTAELIRQGYMINGSWKYASGVHHATHITANCVIVKDGEPLRDTNGEQLILPFVFDREDVTLLPGWKYMGMMGTGSDAYAVKNLRVDFNRCFKIDPAAAVISKPLYQYPFLQLAEATLAANLSGMCVHFTDLARQIVTERITKDTRLSQARKDVLDQTLKEADDRTAYFRNAFYNSLDQSWTDLTKTGSISTEALKAVSSASRQLARVSRANVDILYPYCGLRAAAPDTEINQVWRDFHTASQHSLLTFME